MANLQVTIDDGPNDAASLKLILDEIDRRKIVGAFFIIGEEVKANHTATKLIHSRGHIMGNHSWDHFPRLGGAAKYSEDEIRTQYKDTNDEIKKATNVTAKHWRAPRLDDPQGRVTRALTVGPNAIFTLSHCDVNADSRDYQFKDVPGMLKSIRGDIAAQPQRTNFRLLFHVLPHTAASIRGVLDGLVADGHTLVDFSQVT